MPYSSNGSNSGRRDRARSVPYNQQPQHQDDGGGDQSAPHGRAGRKNNRRRGSGNSQSGPSAMLASSSSSGPSHDRGHSNERSNNPNNDDRYSHENSASLNKRMVFGDDADGDGFDGDGYDQTDSLIHSILNENAAEQQMANQAADDRSTHTTPDAKRSSSGADLLNSTLDSPLCRIDPFLSSAAAPATPTIVASGSGFSSSSGGESTNNQVAKKLIHRLTSTMDKQNLKQMINNPDGKYAIALQTQARRKNREETRKQLRIIGNMDGAGAQSGSVDASCASAAALELEPDECVDASAIPSDIFEEIGRALNVDFSATFPTCDDDLTFDANSALSGAENDAFLMERLAAADGDGGDVVNEVTMSAKSDSQTDANIEPSSANVSNALQSAKHLDHQTDTSSSRKPNKPPSAERLPRKSDALLLTTESTTVVTTVRRRPPINFAKLRLWTDSQKTTPFVLTNRMPKPFVGSATQANEDEREYILNQMPKLLRRRLLVGRYVNLPAAALEALRTTERASRRYRGSTWENEIKKIKRQQERRNKEVALKLSQSPLGGSVQSGDLSVQVQPCTTESPAIVETSASASKTHIRFDETDQLPPATAVIGSVMEPAAMTPDNAGNSMAATATLSKHIRFGEREMEQTATDETTSAELQETAAEAAPATMPPAAPDAPNPDNAPPDEPPTTSTATTTTDAALVLPPRLAAEFVECDDGRLAQRLNSNAELRETLKQVPKHIRCAISKRWRQLNDNEQAESRQRSLSSSSTFEETADVIDVTPAMPSVDLTAVCDDGDDAMTTSTTTAAGAATDYDVDDMVVVSSTTAAQDGSPMAVDAVHNPATETPNSTRIATNPTQAPSTDRQQTASVGQPENVATSTIVAAVMPTPSCTQALAGTDSPSQVDKPNSTPSRKSSSTSIAVAVATPAPSKPPTKTTFRKSTLSAAPSPAPSNATTTTSKTHPSKDAKLKDSKQAKTKSADSSTSTKSASSKPSNSTSRTASSIKSSSSSSAKSNNRESRISTPTPTATTSSSSANERRSWRSPGEKKSVPSTIDNKSTLRKSRNISTVVAAAYAASTSKSASSSAPKSGDTTVLQRMKDIDQQLIDSQQQKMRIDEDIMRLQREKARIEAAQMAWHEERSRLLASLICGSGSGSATTIDTSGSSRRSAKVEKKSESPIDSKLNILRRVAPIELKPTKSGDSKRKRKAEVPIPVEDTPPKKRKRTKKSVIDLLTDSEDSGDSEPARIPTKRAKKNTAPVKPVYTPAYIDDETMELYINNPVSVRLTRVNIERYMEQSSSSSPSSSTCNAAETPTTAAAICNAELVTSTAIINSNAESTISTAPTVLCNAEPESLTAVENAPRPCGEFDTQSDSGSLDDSASTSDGAASFNGDAGELVFVRVCIVGKFLLAASETGKLFKYLWRNGRLVDTFTQHTQTVTDIAETAPSTILSCSVDGFLRHCQLKVRVARECLMVFL